jgi:hypothetical protein
MVEVEAEVRENVAGLLASDHQITDKINAESDGIGPWGWLNLAEVNLNSNVWPAGLLFGMVIFFSRH